MEALHDCVLVRMLSWLCGCVVACMVVSTWTCAYVARSERPPGLRSRLDGRTSWRRRESFACRRLPQLPRPRPGCRTRARRQRGPFACRQLLQLYRPHQGRRTPRQRRPSAYPPIHRPGCRHSLARTTTGRLGQLSVTEKGGWRMRGWGGRVLGVRCVREEY